MKVYYEQDGIVVRTSDFTDVEYLAPRLRESDVKEVWASNHHTPFMALYHSYDKSILCLTIEYDGEAVAMFGLNGENVLSNIGTVWLLGSDELFKHRIRFIRHSKRFLNIMLNMYPTIFNYVHAENKESIDWLIHCGAKIAEPQPYGMEQEMFRYFQFERTV